MSALGMTENAICRNPTAAHARPLAWFLAALYDGPQYPFNLTDLRALDYELACERLPRLPELRSDGTPEVHRQLSSAERAQHRWIDDYGIRPSGSRTEWVNSDADTTSESRWPLPWLR